MKRNGRERPKTVDDKPCNLDVGPQMCSNSSGFIHKVFLTGSAAFAERCASRIRSTHPDLRLDIHSDFEPYISGVHKQVSERDLIRINYFFIDELVLALPALDPMRNLQVSLLIGEGVDGVGFDLIQCTENQTSDPCSYAQPSKIISSGLYRGGHIKRNKCRFRRELISKIQTLSTLKSFIPKVHNCFLSGDFLDSCFQKLQGAIRATGGVLDIEEKKGGGTIFRKVYGRAFPARQDFSPETPEREARPPAAWICASIESAHARGYFKIDVEPPITAGDKALVKAFREWMGLLIDNTINTREKLQRSRLNLSLIEFETGALMSEAKSGDGRELDSAGGTPAGGFGAEASSLELPKPWMACGCFRAPACRSSGCVMDKSERERRSLFDNEIRIFREKSAKRAGKNDWEPARSVIGQAPRGVAVSGEMVGKYSFENKFSHIELLAWLGEFSAKFAHEIRNPVTGISSSAQFLYETADIAEEYKAVIEEILLGSKMLEETVKKYLNLAKAPEPRLEKCSLNALLEEVCRNVQAGMVSRKITVEFRPGRELPSIYADPGQVRHVYMNLVTNAMEAMPDGGKLVISTSLKTENADSKASGRVSVVSSISDSGMGINPEDTERVFDPFYTTKHSGAGLGLYTSFNILRKHNAEIHLLSEAGKGTEVTVSFPLPSGG